MSVALPNSLVGTPYSEFSANSTTPTGYGGGGGGGGADGGGSNYTNGGNGAPGYAFLQW